MDLRNDALLLSNQLPSFQQQLKYKNFVLKILEKWSLKIFCVLLYKIYFKMFKVPMPKCSFHIVWRPIKPSAISFFNSLNVMFTCVAKNIEINQKEILMSYFIHNKLIE